MAEKPVNVTPEDQKLQHANAQQNDLARVLAFLEETVKSRVDLNGFERDRIFIAAGETAHLSPPPFARSVVMVGLSSWTLTTMGTLSFSVTNPTAFIPILTPGAPVDVKNPTSADAQVTVVYLGENPSQLMASLFATTSTLTAQLTNSSVTLSGSLAPLTAAAPKLLKTIPYTDITSTSSNNIIAIPGVLSRNARARSIIAYNGFDVNVGTLNVAAYDSSLISSTSLSLQGDVTQLTGPASKVWSIATSEESSASDRGLLATHFDSWALYIGVSTLPTSGDLEIYVTELF